MNTYTIDHYTLAGFVNNICRDMAVDRWVPDYVVGITRGGLLPAVMISQYFDVPCHTLRISLQNGKTDCESNEWMAAHAFEGKNILIVEDINDSGATLNWLMVDWENKCLFSEPEEWSAIWNNNVRFAVVVDNLGSKCRVGMDYVGTEINKDEDDTWIDFPWENWWTK